MYGWYAPDPRMRANIGIRRRLAPLLDNSRAEIELINALLLSLPGSPVPVLRRRDRDGRQHLARRPRRRADPDAVDAGPQRRLLHGRPRQAVPAGGAVARLPLRARSTSRRSWPRRRRCCTGRAAMLAVRQAAPGVRARAGSSRWSATTRTCWRSCGCSRRRRRRARPPETMLCVNNLSQRPRRARGWSCPGHAGAPSWPTCSAAPASPPSPATARCRSRWARGTSSGSRSTQSDRAPAVKATP